MVIGRLGVNIVAKMTALEHYLNSDACGGGGTIITSTDDSGGGGW